MSVELFFAIRPVGPEEMAPQPPRSVWFHRAVEPYRRWDRIHNVGVPPVCPEGSQPSGCSTAQWICGHCTTRELRFICVARRRGRIARIARLSLSRRNGRTRLKDTAERFRSWSMGTSSVPGTS